MVARLSGMAGIGLALAAILSIAAMTCSDRSDAPAASPATREPAATATPVRNADAILAELARAGNTFRTATFRAVYDFAGKASAGDSTGTVVVAARPPKQLFRIEASTAGHSSTIVTIDDGASQYLCTDTGAKGCMKASVAGSRAGAIPPGLDVAAIVQHIAGSNAATVGDAPGQRIANRDGRCYRIDGAEAGSGILCMSSADGLLLLLDGTFGGSKLMLKATAISDVPAESDFVPPYPVVERVPN